MGFLNIKAKENKNLVKNSSYQNVPLICPRCHIYMKKVNKNGVTIDFCTKCRGMWLDDKEIDKLMTL
jgi:hypothetical protein